MKFEFTNIVNLTAHPVNIYDQRDETGEELIVSFPSEGEARVAVESSALMPATHHLPEHGYIRVIPIHQRTFGEVENLPDPVDGTLYIVSSMVMAQLPERRDLVAPDTGHGSVVRHPDGRIKGVRRFTRDFPRDA